MTRKHVGEKFGSLTILSIEAQGRRRIADCLCDCGARKLIRADHVTSGRQISCNCQMGSATHRMTRTKTYRIWQAMRERCSNPNRKGYQWYGGRGISVCERWSSFENFLADMGECPNAMSIDRIDSNGNYEPNNCRWASTSEQANNKSNTVRVHFQGRERALSEVISLSGSSVPDNALRMRLKMGWDLARALAEPVRPHRKEIIENALCCVGFGLCVFATLTWGLL